MASLNKDFPEISPAYRQAIADELSNTFISLKKYGFYCECRFFVHNYTRFTINDKMLIELPDLFFSSGLQVFLHKSGKASIYCDVFKGLEYISAQIDQAVENFEFTARPCKQKKKEKKQGVEMCYSPEVHKEFRTFSFAQKLSMVRTLLLKDKLDKNNSFSQLLTYYDRDEYHLYLNSYGENHIVRLPFTGLIYKTTVHAPGKKPCSLKKQLGESAGLEFIDYVKSKNYFYFLKKQCDDLVDSVTLHKELDFDYLVLDRDISALLFHEVVGHFFEGDSLLDRYSWIKPRDISRKQFMDNKISIFMDPALGQAGFCPMDNEGIPASNFPIIKEGRITGIPASREVKFKNLTRSGHNRASEFFTPPITRMSNLVLDFKENLQENIPTWDFNAVREFLVKHKIYVNGKRVLFLSGKLDGYSNFRTGRYHIYPQAGYMFDADGTTTYTGLRLYGNGLGILHNVILTAGDYGPTFELCLKRMQRVPTSCTAPKIIVLKKNNTFSVEGQ